MGRKTTQRIRISTTSGRLPKVQEVIQDHAARKTPWPTWTRNALYLLGAALVVLSVAGMWGIAFHDAEPAVAARGER